MITLAEKMPALAQVAPELLEDPELIALVDGFTDEEFRELEDATLAAVQAKTDEIRARRA